MTATEDAAAGTLAASSEAGPAPLAEIAIEPHSPGSRALIVAFVAVPFLAVLAAVLVAPRWGISWLDLGLLLGFYEVSGHGVTMGFHRYFTHGAFKAKPALKIALAIAGSLAIEGSVITWVSDHRRHHKYSDKGGDPHSPWRYGDDLWALTKGFLYAHIGWLFRSEVSNREKFSPDWLADPGVKWVSDTFGLWVLVSLLLPAAIGGLVTMSWQGAVTAFFWASLVRICLLHHVTWSINSVCHTFGNVDFEVRDKSRNVAWLAIASFGESWHNLHHSDPTCARHGALKGQLDSTARCIWSAEKLGWAYDVRWPEQLRLEKRQQPRRRNGRRRYLGSMTRRTDDESNQAA